ncbi:sigma-70 family RNA polymerase sigma factor [Aquibacillus halophilus]|uniref:Sigma-70 family RNA polymerase sigma factor n=1 Tax=Aquibacillus halophilus TaxID=930132 RepID=A0A6A8D986_9BACI|nr:sigma-70 family RNA polymerase sigma factor [Aquibacillus halophilus]MRH41096.1 sigma-70 family RNA polymerase sigma factor [Aquibacillus halophilus]
MVEIQSTYFNDILKAHENMIYHLINKLGIRDPDKEFYQEGVIAIWRAVETYDENRGKFSSYAYFLIEKGLLSLIRQRNRQVEKDNYYLEKLSTDESRVLTSLEIGFDPYLLNSIEEILTDNQLKWFKLFVLEDLSIKEIANIENVTEDAVKNWGRLARPKLRALLKDDGIQLQFN